MVRAICAKNKLGVRVPSASALRGPPGEPKDVFSDDAITFAGVRFQAGQIQQSDMTPPAGNQTRLLEFARNQGHARTTDSYQCRQEFLGQGQVIGPEQVATLEKPSTNPLVGRMNGVTTRN